MSAVDIRVAHPQFTASGRWMRRCDWQMIEDQQESNRRSPFKPSADDQVRSSPLRGFA